MIIPRRVQMLDIQGLITAVVVPIYLSLCSHSSHGNCSPIDASMISHVPLVFFGGDILLKIYP